MSFHDLLNGLLSELDIPYFEGSPELSDSTPEAFIFYNVYDVPALRGLRGGISDHLLCDGQRLYHRRKQGPDR